MSNVTAITQGIYQVRLPLPFALSSVNCYLLEDTQGWTVIDTGLHYPAGQAGWEAAFAELNIKPEAIQRIVLTHSHPDHYGMSGWLAEQSGAPVLLAAQERAFALEAWHAGKYGERDLVDFFLRYGMPEDLTRQVQNDMIAMRQVVSLPAETQILVPESWLSIGSRRFRAIATPGHSDEHLVFYCPDEQLLLCGDAVLTKITPNVGLWPFSHENPLADFLQSLQTLQGLSVDLALPGHGPLIRNFETRLTELVAHHDQRLAIMEDSVGKRATAFTVCSSVFSVATFTSHEMRFALAETLAHLEYLVKNGRLERSEQGGEVLYHQPG